LFSVIATGVGAIHVAVLLNGRIPVGAGVAVTAITMRLPAIVIPMIGIS
jgi:hypothetical protein